MDWLSRDDWNRIKAAVVDAGFADAIAWQDGVGRPETSDVFALEACWVILNSGMAYRVTRKLWPRIRGAIIAGDAIPFGHAGKVAAMTEIWRDRERLWPEIPTDDEALVEWCAGLPWIGQITKFHLAKNLGADVCKPDVWMQRLASYLGVSAHEACRAIAEEMGERIATVDLILWAALSNKIITPTRPTLAPAHPDGGT